MMGMSTRLAAQLALIRPPEKLADRLVAAGIAGAPATQGRDLSEKPVLGYVLEVTRPWLPSSKLLPLLVETLEAQVAHLTSKTPLDDQFEAVLKAVNQTLNDISESGETDWIGNFNGLIVLLGNNELHFSQTGNLPAYLLQNNRIRQITDDPHDPDPHPIKTFSNLASGQLNENDTLLIANQELYNEISLDALRRIMNTATPRSSCLAIAKELRTERNSKVSALITNIRSSKETVAEAEVVDLSEFMESRAKKVYKTLLPGFQTLTKHSKALGAASLSLARKAGESGMAAAKQVSEQAKQKLAEKKSEPTPNLDELPSPSLPEEDIVSPPSAPAKEQLAQEEPSPTTEAREEIHSGNVEVILPKERRDAARSAETEAEIGSIIPASEFAVEQESLPGDGSPEAIAPASQALWDRVMHIITVTIPKQARTFLVWFSEWIQVPKNKKITALGVAGILILSVVWGAVAGRGLPAPTEEGVVNNQTLLKDVQEIADRLPTEIELEQNIQASRLIEEAYGKLGQVVNPSDSQADQATELWQAITQQADVLTKTVRLTTSTTYNFPGNPVSFIAAQPYFFARESASNRILRTGTGTLPNLQESNSLPDANEVIANVSRSTDPDTAGLVLTKQSRVFRIIQSGNTTLLREISPASGEFAASQAIAAYAGNIYLLDGVTGLVWRYRGTGTSYEGGVSMLDANQVDLSNSISFAIDGSLFFLKQDGSILKVTAGQVDTNFSTESFPELTKTLIRPVKILTNESFSNVYVLDGGTTASNHSTAKIIEFDKNGVFKRQFAFSDEFTNVQSFDINPKEGKLWVLNNGTLHEFTIP